MLWPWQASTRLDELAGWIDSVARQQQELGQLVEQLNENRNARDEFAPRIEAFARQQEDLSRLVASLNDSIGGNRTQLDAFAERMDAMAGRQEGLAERMDAFAARQEDFAARMEAIGRQREDLNELVNQLNASAGGNRAQLDAFATRMDDFARRQEEFAARTEAHARQQGGLNELVGRLNESAGGNRSQLDALNGLVSQLRTNVDRLNSGRPPQGTDVASTEARYPSRFQFQNPDRFLLSGDDLDRMTAAERAPFLTEALNRKNYEFMSAATGYLATAGVRGCYMEFGCFSANSFRMFLSQARLAGLEAMDLHAFDSFEGLPEFSSRLGDGVPWTQGSMAMSENEFRETIRRHGIWADRLHIVKGFYEHSLSPELQRELLGRGCKIAMLNLDCDLYESALPVCRFIEPFLQEGSLVYIDDFFAGYQGSPERGVAKAFLDFAANSEFRFQPFLHAGWWGMSFIAYRPDPKRTEVPTSATSDPQGGSPRSVPLR